MGKIEIVDPDTGEIFEYDECKIKRYRPGAAYGANDIQNWANNRALGRFGSYSHKDELIQKKRVKKLCEKSKKRVDGFGAYNVDGTKKPSNYVAPKKKKKHKQNRTKKNKRKKILAHIQKYSTIKATKKEADDPDTFLATKLPWDY